MTPEQERNEKVMESAKKMGEKYAPTLEKLAVQERAEQERAEVKIDKTKIVAWLKHMIEGNEFAEADGEASAYKFTLGRIEDGKFDSNSLDREEQLITEVERITKDRDEAYSDLRGVLSQLDTRDIQLGSARTEVAEQDKEIQRLQELLGGNS